MTRRAFRLLLVLGLIGAAALAGYQGWKLERARVQQLASAQANEALTQRLAQGAIEIRAAQRAYVASGQGYAYWKPSVDRTLQQLRQDLTALKTSVPRTAAAVDAALESLNETARVEKRIEEAASAGRIPFAADLIFADGLQANLGLQRALDAVITSTRGDLEIYQREARMQELLLAAESACIGLFLALMWFPAQTKPSAAPATGITGRTFPDLPLRADTNRVEVARAAVAARDRMRPEPTPTTTAPPQPASPAVPTAPTPATAVVDATANNTPIPAAALVSRDTLAAAADLCTSLARVNDATELNGLVAQMSTQLDAAGVIVWLTAPDGLSLRPALSHGYAPEAIARLERLDLAADNATARAYRLVRPQTVAAKDSTPGALVVPITTGAGCVGAVAAELRHGREQDATTLALARIFAAQLATLTGPSAGN
jgi:hypothetical protein